LRDMGRRWLRIAALLIVCGPASASAPDAQRFTAEIAARIAKAAPQVHVAIAGPLTLKLEGGPEGENQLNLDRILAFCAANSAEDCEGTKSRFVAAAVETATGDYTVTRERLRVVVRSADYARMVQDTLGKDGAMLVTRPVGDGLVAMLAADFPKTLSLVPLRDLAALHLSEAEAFELGRRNVLAHLPKLPTAADLKQRVIMIAGEDYDASLILADGWGQLAHDTDGKLFMTVASDNELVVGVADEEQIRRLRNAVAEDFRTAERGVSPEVYRWSEGGWVAVK
jgi:hypothetical protein